MCRFCAATLRVMSPLDELAFAAATKWGAEDIYMSLVAASLTGQKNLVLPYTDEQLVPMNPGRSSVAISRAPGHYVFRDEFVKRAARVLKCLRPYQQLPQSS